MVDTSHGVSLKLIDFSDSWICNEKENVKLCGTLPYSPLESSKNSKSHLQIGIDKP